MKIHISKNWLIGRSGGRKEGRKKEGEGGGERQVGGKVDR